MTGNTDIPRRVPAGFTLVEVLVATAVISIATIIAVQLLFIYFGIQQETRDILYLEGASRNALSLMAERVRHGFIEYGYYTTTPADEPEYLAVRDKSGELTVFWFRDAGGGTYDLFMCDDKRPDETCAKGVNPEIHPDWNQVNDATSKFVYGRFGIVPFQDPLFTGPGQLEPASDTQSLVQVYMRMVAEGSGTQTKHIQTTFTPRLYVR